MVQKDSVNMLLNFRIMVSKLAEIECDFSAASPSTSK
jgi:hypothetical protein